MLIAASGLQLSASDLVGHLYCRHLTALDKAVAEGVLKKPQSWDPLLEALWERGAEHERKYIEHLKASGHEVVEIEGEGSEQARADQTIQAMRAGAQIIVQGVLLDGKWSGRTDILRRVPTLSRLGDWSYEVIDTKLARETKGGTVLQLCLYSDLVASVQGFMPEFMYVVIPWTDYQPQPYRTADYAAYYRRVKRGLEESVLQQAADTYPDPKEHCDICRWRLDCEARRRADDHLCLVAGITKVHINELTGRDIGTTTKLAGTKLPLPWKPERGAVHPYERIREQARVQIEGRTKGEPVFETLPVVPGLGLSCLPAPSAGDIFLDLEGDPFVGETGLEYLFGYLVFDEHGTLGYTGAWALSRADEKRVFETFVDFVMERWARYPDLHIYHYAPYEPSALKRLMGRYATREEQIDRMLRASLFVDLYNVVRHGVRASVESYSIKKLEPFYKYERAVPLPDANGALAKLQACLELGEVADIDHTSKRMVEAYNRDDCFSTCKLRDWLEGIRSELVDHGHEIARPTHTAGDPSEVVDERQKRVLDLVARLTADVPADPVARSAEQQARWILAHTLDWHWREDKSQWWELYRLSDLPAGDLMEERAGLAGLTFIANVGGTARAPIHRYQFPTQETEIRGKESLRSVGGAKLGTVVAVSLENRTIDIKKRMDTANFHPEAAFAHDYVGKGEQAAALLRIGEYVAANGISEEGKYQAARDLLLRLPPRLGGAAIRMPTENVLDAALRIAPKLAGGVLPIQGPPGAGKTYTGARMICTLVKAGAKVGITANSHKVIRKLLDEVVKAADEGGVDVQCIQKPDNMEPDRHRIRFAKNNDDVYRALGSACQVAAGTGWLWAPENAYQAVDVLVVDEAAQMSLADVLAVSQAARTVVLLGDPQQLNQPTQGSHPEGTDVSALDHILCMHKTISPNQGLFLDETWRLHPDICEFTSELFYEDKLQSRPGVERQEIRSSSRIRGRGLRYLPVDHEGNQNSAPEEAEKIRDLVIEILSSDTSWINPKGKEEKVELNDILIIAPYNAQVFELQALLPGARIGTVDKFQGQEAPIVIYSMTTSSHADAPRGMEFLYSANRLNVATSRARCVCVLVGSPLLFEAECRTPRQIQLANAFCRYLEMATPI